MSTDQHDDHSDDGTDYADDPVAHDYFFPRPAYSFKMMMKRRNFEDAVFVEIFVGNYLNDNRDRSGDKWQGDDRQDQD